MVPVWIFSNGPTLLLAFFVKPHHFIVLNAGHEHERMVIPKQFPCLAYDNRLVMAHIECIYKQVILPLKIKLKQKVK